MSYETNSKQRTGSQPAAGTTGFAFLDMMLQMQKASTQALSSLIPLTPSPTPTLQATGARYDERSSSSAPVQRSTNSVEVIPVGEETFHVGTRTVQGETTRLRRTVIETPVEQQVSLRTETVIVERRKPANSTPNADVLSEKVVEMNDSFQVVETWKAVHLLEEVVLRTEVVEHTETVRDTVRRDEVQVEQAKAAPRREPEAPKLAVLSPAIQAAAKQLSNDAEAVRSGPAAQKQDTAPAPKAEAERNQPPRPQPEANAQARPPAPQQAQPQPQPQSEKQHENKPAPAPVMAADHNKPGTPPRPEANQADKPSSGPVRRP